MRKAGWRLGGSNPAAKRAGGEGGCGKNPFLFLIFLCSCVCLFVCLFVLRERKRYEGLGGSNPAAKRAGG